MRRLMFALMVLPASVIAQAANQVTLKYDDGSGVSGELIAFEEDIFRIQASVGLIAIPAQDVSCIGAACPEGTTLEVPPAPVVLTSVDGSFRVAGNVIAFEDDQYVVATEIGEIQVKASLVDCEGSGCVSPAEPVVTESITDPVDRSVSLVDGTMTIEGDLVRVENGAYIIEVEQLGELRVDANTFECRGAACP